MSDHTMKLSNPKDAVGVRKAPLSTVPGTFIIEMGRLLNGIPHPQILFEVGLGMLEGGRKYGRHNYREAGVRASVYYDAAFRHLLAWWSGEDIDPDSGLPHLSKFLASMAVLMDSIQNNLWEDDRPPAIRYTIPLPPVKDDDVQVARALDFMILWWEGGDFQTLLYAIKHVFIARMDEIDGVPSGRPPQDEALPKGWMAPLHSMAGEIIDRHPNAKDPITQKLILSRAKPE